MFLLGVISSFICITAVTPLLAYTPGKSQQGVYPVFAYSSKTGLLLGAMYLNQSPKWKSNSILILSQKYGKMLFSDIHDIPLEKLNPQLTLEASLKLYDWKDGYFQCGDTSLNKITKSCEELLVDNTQYNIITGPRYWISDSLSTSFQLNYNQRSENETQEIPRQFNDEKNMGFEFDLKYDTRDDHLSAKSGIYAQNKFLLYPSFLRTGDTMLLQWLVDTRYYYKYQKHNIASRLYLAQTLSKTETVDYFISRLRLGSQNELRGEDINRYMGRAITLIQSEYRYQFFKKLRGVLFLELGQAGDTIGFANLITTKGLGLHYSMKHNVIVRLEMGFAKHTKNFIFSFNTAF